MLSLKKRKDMSNEILIALSGLFTTIVSGWASWFFTRKKYNSEVDGQIVQNMEKSLEFYKKLSDDNTVRLESLTHKNSELERQVEELKKQVTDLAISICIDYSCAHRLRNEKLKEEGTK